MEEKKQILKEFGLSGNEEIVYLNLLELGTINAGKLIKKTGLHRAAVYDNLDLLSEKGLVSYVVKANRKYFIAQPPVRLKEILDTNLEKVEKAKVKLKELIPALEQKRLISKSPQEATILK